MADNQDIWLCPRCGEVNNADMDRLSKDEAVSVDCRACRRPSRLVLDIASDGESTIRVTTP